MSKSHYLIQGMMQDKPHPTSKCSQDTRVRQYYKMWFSYPRRELLCLHQEVQNYTWFEHNWIKE